MEEILKKNLTILRKIDRAFGVVCVLLAFGCLYLALMYLEDITENYPLRIHWEKMSRYDWIEIITLVLIGVSGMTIGFNNLKRADSSKRNHKKPFLAVLNDRLWLEIGSILLVSVVVIFLFLISLKQLYAFR